MTIHDRATTISARQHAAADFARAGAALFGPDWKAPLAAQLEVKTTTIDDMSKGRSRIPPSMWNEIAGLIQDRERLLPIVKAAVLEHATAPVHRLYRGPGGLEFGIMPNGTGQWPTVQFCNSWPMGWWETLADDERRLPDDSVVFRLVFEGVYGVPVPVQIGSIVHYPDGFKPVS